jgi:hypothetical protein
MCQTGRQARRSWLRIRPTPSGCLSCTVRSTGTGHRATHRETSIARRNLPGVFGAPEPYTEEQRRRLLPGRVPFVVPPSAVKSPYYRNPVIREIWQQAADSLRQADRVFVVGYSLPPTDLTLAGMLTSALADSQATVTVIDLRASAVAERLASLGFPSNRIEVFEPGPQPPVPAFSGRWRDETSASVLDSLRDAKPDTLQDPMVVVWGEQAFAPVVKVTDANGVVTLETGPITSFHAATRPRDENSPPPGLPVLQDVTRQSRAHTPLAVATPNGSKQAIIGWAVARTNIGYGKDVWNALTPSGTLSRYSSIGQTPREPNGGCRSQRCMTTERESIRDARITSSAEYAPPCVRSQVPTRRTASYGQHLEPLDDVWLVLCSL